MKYKSLLFFSMLLLSAGAKCQTIIRSSIGPMGQSTNTEGIVVQQAVGQPYGSKSYYSNEIESRPGFIQPSNISIEFVNSTFKVEMDVYPNPSTSQVEFKLNENLENINLKVVNQSGQIILSREIESLRGYVLNCSEWDNGTYTIYLTDVSGNHYQTKLIKL